MKKYTKTIFSFTLTFLILSFNVLNFGYVAKASTSNIGVTYQGHVQNKGWQNTVYDGEDAGTAGLGLRMEALKINLTNAPVGAHISYQGHVQNVGWQNAVQDGVEVGTAGLGLRVEAIKINLVNVPGYSVQYRTHVQNIGWQDWVTNGSIAGTTGKGLRIEAIEIKIVPNVSATSISLNKKTSALAIGKTDSLTAKANPSNSTDAITWSSSNPKVASVDSSGNVTGIATGVANITATAESGTTDYCTYTVTNNPISVTKLKLNKATDSINLRTADTLKAIITPTNATDTNVSWVSSDPSVATVNNGVVTAVNLGTTTITAISDDGSMTDSCIVTITPLALTGITVNHATDAISIGGVDILSVVFAPVYATDTNVNWRSSNTNVVTVDSNGLITGVGLGSAIVTAISEDGGKTSSCTVTVSPTKVTKVTVTPAIDDSLVVGNTVTLTANVIPGDAANQAVLWTSSNPAVATVSNGVVTGVKASTTPVIITATTLDGGKTSTSKITVIGDPSLATGLTLTGSSIVNKRETLSLNGVYTDTLTATLTPATSATNVLWKSNDDTVVSVNSSGSGGTGVITGIKIGKATITAYSAQNNSVLDSVTITVTGTPIPVTAISLDQTTLDVPIGSTKSLSASIAPSSATNKNITWQVVTWNSYYGEYVSSSSSYITIDNNGTVAGLHKTIPGYPVMVRATSVSTGISSPICSINVIPVYVTSINLNKTSETFKVGDTDTLTATTVPSYATEQGITWSSNDPSIATVDPNTGFVTAKKNGSTSIIATSKDGSASGHNITASCEVTVNTNPAYVTGMTLTASGLTGFSGPISSTTPAASGNLSVYGSTALTARINPSTATNQNLLWTCHDEGSTASDVASFDHNNNTGSTVSITGYKPGVSIITATSASDGSIVGTFRVTVLGITLTSASPSLADDSSSTSLSPYCFNANGKLTLSTGVTAKIVASADPANIVGSVVPTIQWSCHDGVSTSGLTTNTCATIDSSTGIITGISAGTSTITAKTSTGLILGTYTVAVTP